MYLSSCNPPSTCAVVESGAGLFIARLSVMSHTLPHAASGSDKSRGGQPPPPTTRDPVAQAPTTDQGVHKKMNIAKITDI